MSPEALLPILSKAVRGCIDHNLVVAGLESDGFSGRVRRRGDERVHVGLGDEFDGDVDIQFPCTQGLVV